MKIPLTSESLSPLSKAIWPSSFSDTRDERLLKLNPSGVGTVGEEALLERSVLRADEQPLLERVVQLGNDRDPAERVHRLIGDEELRDEVAARRIDGVRDRGQRSARAQEDALPPLRAAPVVSQSGAQVEAPEVSLEGHLAELVDRRIATGGW